MSLAREQPRQRNLPLWIAGITAVLLLGGFGIWAFLNTRPESAVVSRRNLIAIAPVEGEVVAPPDERADILAPFEAPVAKVYTTVGAEVQRGDVLVELSVPNAQQAYNQARARVQAAETAYANAEKQFEASLSAARQRLRAAERAEQSALAAAQPEPPPATEENGTVTVRPVQPTPPATSGAEVAAASQERIAAEQELAQLEAQRAASLAPFRQQLESAREYFNEAKSGRKMGMLRAPISGTVLALNAQPGQMAGESDKTPVAVVVDLDELEVQGPIPAEYASLVKAGMPARISVKEVPNEQFEGKLHAITTRTTGTLLKKQEYVAVLHLKNREGLVKPQMNATAGIELEERKDVLAVPNEALREDSSGRPMVRVLRNGNWQDVVVEVGVTDGRYTEIKEGLKDGETVQVKPRLL